MIPNHFKLSLPSVVGVSFLIPMRICKRVIVIFCVGLSLTLYINQPQYIPVLTQEAGIRVLLHRQGQVPIMEEDGFDVNPGTKSGIAVRYVSNMGKKFC